MKMNKQSGQVLISVALGLVVLAGFAGLAIDMGTLRYQRRLQQTAADAAALSAASNLVYSSGVTLGARNAATLNGFTDNNAGAGCVGGAVGCVSVAVNIGPTVGPHTGDTKYVETTVTAIQPTYFMNIFGVNSSLVATRAVATNISGGSKNSCLVTLGAPTAAIEGVNVTGNAKINAPNCGIADNGNFDTTGNAYTVVADSFAVSGKCVGNDCKSSNVVCSQTATGCPTYGTAAAPDPLTNGPTPIAPPSLQPVSSTCGGVVACDWVSPTGATTIQPGTYHSLLIGKNSVVTMAPGIYYIDGSVGGSGAGLNFQGGATLTSQGYLGGANPCGSTPATQISGVMIFFTNTSTITKAVGGGGVNVPNINLCPMNSTQPENPSGTYTGLLMYQDPADTVQAYLSGNNTSTFNGEIYMPTAQLTFYGDASFTVTGQVVVNSIAITGNPTVNLGFFPGGSPATANLTVPALVE
jgi:Flp pilus assembly protein TadG